MLQIRLNSTCPWCKKNKLALQCHLSSLKRSQKFSKYPAVMMLPERPSRRYRVDVLYCPSCGKTTKDIPQGDDTNIDFDMLENILRETTERTVREDLAIKHLFTLQEGALRPWSPGDNQYLCCVREVKQYRDLVNPPSLPPFRRAVSSWYWNTKTRKLFQLQSELPDGDTNKPSLRSPLSKRYVRLTPVFSDLNNYQEVLYIPSTLIVR